MLTYLLLFALGFVSTAFFFWLATQVMGDVVGRLGRRGRWAERPDHELGLAFIAPLVAFVAFVLAFLIICLNRDHSFGTILIEAAGPFALAAVVSVGWSRRSRWVWVAQMMAPGLVFALIAWLLIGD